MSRGSLLLAVGSALLLAVVVTALLRSPSPPAPAAPETKEFPRPTGATGASSEGGDKLRKVMHRVRAGDPDESGWGTAKPTDGDFVVRLPGLFNDFTSTGRAEDGVEIKSFGVGTATRAGVKFSALAMRRPDGKFKADPLAGTVEEFEKQGVLKEKRSITL